MLLSLTRLLALFLGGSAAMQGGLRAVDAEPPDPTEVKVIRMGDAQGEPQVMVLRRGAPQTGGVTGSGQRTVVMQSAPNVAGGMVLALGQGEDEDQSVTVFKQDMPSQWVGVLMTPVPEPLAAHVGSAGMMIANVVNDSPADQAGLERYDVVLAFDGQQVDDMEDLTGAIAGVEVGQQTEISVMHGGKVKTLKITPVKRPDPGKWSYKYEEPEKEYVDESMRLWGRRLKPGPGGAWILENLGPMMHVPDVLMKLEELDGDALKKLEELDLKGLDVDDFDIAVRAFAPPHEWLIMEDGDEGSAARVEVSVQVDDDGNVTTIRRDADGKIHVKHVDADGNESNATYDSAEEFKEEDPEGYKLYRRYSAGGVTSWVTQSFPGAHLDKARQHYQVAVEKRVKEALDRSKEAQEQAHEAAEKAREQVKIMLKKHEDQPQPQPQTGETLTVELEDGKITVTVIDGGRRSIHRFNSKQEFKDNAPRLYEQVKDMLE